MNEEEFRQQAVPTDVCRAGRRELKACRTISDWIDSYLKGINFCLAKEHPKISLMRRYSKDLEGRGVYVDTNSLVSQNQERTVFLGESVADLTFNNFCVAIVYAKHFSKIKIKAKEYAYVLVDAFDKAEIEIEAKGGASVTVNLYGDATCTGNAKVIHTRKKTYDLQARQ